MTKAQARIRTTVELDAAHAELIDKIQDKEPNLSIREIIWEGIELVAKKRTTPATATGEERQEC